jgi:hypothetical protein
MWLLNLRRNLRCSHLTTLLLILLCSPAASALEQLKFNEVILRVSGAAPLTPGQQATMTAWLDHLTASMLLVYGAQPHPELQIELQTYGGGNRAVAFGQVLRKRPPGMRFYINPNQSLDSFINDWTPYHEASHLFIPYPGQADIWLSEGLASYYQNVLRYRAGVLTEEETWQKLVSGFERARDDSRHAEFTLATLSRELRERYAYMRVYWSGALYFLAADIELRERSANQMSLDIVLGEFAACCLRQNRRWTGADIVQRFDALSGYEIFAPLYSEYAQSLAIPDFTATLRSAGVAVAGGQVQPIERPPNFDLGGIGGQHGQ